MLDNVQMHFRDFVRVEIEDPCRAVGTILEVLPATRSQSSYMNHLNYCHGTLAVSNTQRD